MHGKNLSAQELYDALYNEALSRKRAAGQMPQTDEQFQKFEVDVFKTLYEAAKQAIKSGEAPPDFMDELGEVKAFHTREKAEARWREERDKALREGTVLSIDDLLK